MRNYVPSDLYVFAIVVFLARRTKVRLPLENNDSFREIYAKDESVQIIAILWIVSLELSESFR